MGSDVYLIGVSFAHIDVALTVDRLLDALRVLPGLAMASRPRPLYCRIIQTDVSSAPFHIALRRFLWNRLS